MSHVTNHVETTTPLLISIFVIDDNGSMRYRDRNERLLVASILKRMVTTNDFSNTVALLCAGFDLEEARNGNNINELDIILRHRLRQHLDPNHSLENDKLRQRYQIFVQYAEQ